MGILDKAVEAEGKIPFAEYAEKLSDAALRAGEFKYIFDALSALCEVMEIKAELGVRTRKAYRADNKAELTGLLNKYTVLSERLKTFYKLFKELWMRENKSFGWEIQDARLGGVMLRIRSCKERLEEYISGKIPAVEELDEDILPYVNGLELNNYRLLVSPSDI